MGLPTASQFHRILSAKTLKPLAGAETYALELLVQWGLGLMEGEDSDFMERGRLFEEDAVAAYELETNCDVQRVGFITNDAGTVGYSPDGLVGDDGLVEFKVPAAKTHLAYLLNEGDVGPYMAQCQGGLWVAEREWIDWRSWHQSLPAAKVRMGRDEKFIAALSEAVGEFCDRLAAAKARLLGMGFVPVGEQSGKPEYGATPSDILA